MTTFFNSFYRQLSANNFMSTIRQPCILFAILLIWILTACTHIAPLSLSQDLAAEQIVNTIKQTNIDLIRFKCVGKITVSSPDQPVQSYRSAIAGQLNDHLRIDLFAPFGGAAGTVASDGRHLFLVLHAPREYHKKRFGDGNLHRFIKMKVTVGDLLELMVGRIPLNSELVPMSMPEENSDRIGVCLVDRYGQTRQRITLGMDGRPLRVLWFDTHDRQTLSLEIRGQQMIDDFVLPKRVDLFATTGQTVSILIERYEANPSLNEGLFVPPPISS